MSSSAVCVSPSCYCQAIHNHPTLERACIPPLHVLHGACTPCVNERALYGVRAFPLACAFVLPGTVRPPNRSPISSPTGIPPCLRHSPPPYPAPTTHHAPRTTRTTTLFHRSGAFGFGLGSEASVPPPLVQRGSGFVSGPRPGRVQKAHNPTFALPLLVHPRGWVLCPAGAVWAGVARCGC